MGSPHQDEAQENDKDQHRNPPPPPEPEHDTGIVPPIKSPHLQGLDHLTPENIDIFTLDAVAALKLLSRGAGEWKDFCPKKRVSVYRRVRKKNHVLSRKLVCKKCKDGRHLCMNSAMPPRLGQFLACIKFFSLA